MCASISSFTEEAYPESNAGVELEKNKCVDREARSMAVILGGLNTEIEKMLLLSFKNYFLTTNRMRNRNTVSSDCI